MEESRSTIDGYARTEGATWRVMRDSCILPLQEHPRKRDNGHEKPREECEYLRLVELRDPLAISDTEQNCEVVTNVSSLGSIWKKMVRPHPVCAPHGGEKASEFFNKMLEKGLWIKHDGAIKGPPRYFPVVRCEGTLEDIYVFEVNDGASEYYEEVNREAHKKYAAIDARWGGQYGSPRFRHPIFVAQRYGGG